MKNLFIFVLVLISTIGLAMASSNSDKDKILNGFAEQERSIPEWIEIKWKNDHKVGVDYQIRYGVGGRVCNSIVKFNEQNHMNELARKCSN